MTAHIKDTVEQAARVLAGLEPGEDWPTNESLGGNGFTGTRDDEYRAAMREQAQELADAGLLVGAAPKRVLPSLKEIAQALREDLPVDAVNARDLHRSYVQADAVLDLLMKTHPGLTPHLM